MTGNYPGNTVTTPQATTPAAGVSGTAGAPDTSSAGGGRVGRRALLATAAVGACAVATPFVAEKGVELSEAEIKALLQREIGSLEGIALDEALQIAEFTRKVVQFIVVPLARFYATISGDALGVLIGALQQAESLLNLVHGPAGLFSGLVGVLQGWRSNVQLFPSALNAMTTGDLNHAETYLKALKSKVS